MQCMHMAWFAKVSLKNNEFQMIMIQNCKNNEEQIIHVIRWYKAPVFWYDELRSSQNKNGTFIFMYLLQHFPDVLFSPNNERKRC